MRVIYLVTKPFVDLLNLMGNAVLKPFGIPPASEAGHSPHTEAELRTLIDQSEREGILDPEERVFAEGAFSFGDRRAREVMIPRPRVRVLTADRTLTEAARTAVDSGHTRLPLCDSTDDLDTAGGFVHVQSLLGSLVDDAPPTLSELATPILRTSEVVLLDELLAELRRQHQHMALLDNEHGTAVGIVTLEDILEQIVGDIRDEYDTEQQRHIEQLSDGSVRVPGKAPLDAVRTKLDLDVAEHREATLGGYLTETAGRVPEPGEVLRIGSWRATVEDRDGSTVSSVLLHRRPEDESR